MKNREAVLTLYSFFVVLISSCIWFLIKGESIQTVVLNSVGISIVATIIVVMGFYMKKVDVLIC